ncbi:MAG: GNAT family N-acetyltransferase [Chloroflexota bacterium]
MYTIREFEPTDAEYAVVVAIHNAIWPEDPETVADWKEWDGRRDPKYLHKRMVVEAGEEEKQIVAVGGYGELAWSHQPGKYFIDIMVRPDYEWQGIEELYFNTINARLEQRDPKPVKYVSDIREDKTQYVEFLKNRGYVQTMRYPISELDVTDYDFSRFEGIDEKVASHGIKIYTVTELMEIDPDWRRHIYELETILDNDVPTPDPITPQPFEQYAKRFQSERFASDGWFMAIDPNAGDAAPGKYVGMSTINLSRAQKEKVYVSMTGTLREYRRKGIATALKLRTIVFTQGIGATYIETDNEENNPMYQLNLMLGFKPKPAWVDFEKPL